MSSTSTAKRKKSSLSSEGDVGKRPKHGRSVLPVEEEGGEGTLEKVSLSLLSGEEADQRDNAGGGEVALKKGPWTKEEDAILVDHINQYGEGNWNAVQKNSGLARDGKSCRLRWANHLRPGLKRGAFTADEERLILENHFLKGSKWAHMAALLPGRTDNEIKNFWYTRSKKRQRAGLPIYPNDINGCQEIADTLANESSQRDETENFNLDITDLDLKHFKFCPDMLPPYFDTQDYKLITDLVGPWSDPSHNKCSRAAVVQRRYLITTSNAAVPEVFDQYGQYLMLSTPCDPILNTNLLHGYDNPIIQNSQTQQCIWSGMYVPPLPSFESVNTPVQPCLSVPAYPDCSHLIDSSVYYNSDQNLKGSSTDSLLQANTDSMAPNEADISTQWNALDDYYRAALVTRHQKNLLRWLRSAYDMYRGAFNDQLRAYYTSNKEDNLNQKDLWLPDAVLDSGWQCV